MSKRTTKAKPFHVHALASVEGLKSTVNQVVELQAELARKTAKHDAEVARINSEFDADTQDLVAKIDGLANAAHIYCEAHREIFPDVAKHIDCRNARVGFRLNPWKIEKVVNKDTFVAIARRLLGTSWGVPFVTQADPEISKELLLSERANLTEEQLQSVGLKITQGETFYISPIIESSEGVAVKSGGEK